MSLDEFLTWENEQELRYELVDGQPVMMTGGRQLTTMFAWRSLPLCESS